MLVIFFSLVLISIILNNFVDLLLLIISLLMIMLFVLLFSNPLFLYTFMYVDDLTLLLWLLSFSITLICIVVVKFKVKKAICMVILVTSLMFFGCVDLLMFFVLFEFSLIPIFLLVIGFGYQPERVMAGQYMMIYTLIASVPFFISMSNSLSQCNDRYLVLYKFGYNLNMNMYLVLGFLLAFLVKIPMFSFHNWLPKAHVEAPLEGSMILAGLMLKMGVFGMLRMIPYIINYLYTSVVFDFLFCISLFGSLFCLMVALSSDDVKMTVAYSSVGHMNFLIASLMMLKNWVFYSSVVMCISHGLCSIMLFYLVTYMYESFCSRSILISKGFYSMVPVLMMFNFFAWSFNLSAPPSINFTSELLMFVSISSVSSLGLVVSLLYVLMNSFYSMLNFGLQSNCNLKLSIKLMNFKLVYMFIMFVTLSPLMFFFFFLDFMIF